MLLGGRLSYAPIAVGFRASASVVAVAHWGAVVAGAGSACHVVLRGRLVAGCGSHHRDRHNQPGTTERGWRCQFCMPAHTIAIANRTGKPTLLLGEHNVSVVLVWACASPQIRTGTERDLNPLPLPVGLETHAGFESSTGNSVRVCLRGSASSTHSSGSESPGLGCLLA